MKRRNYTREILTQVESGRIAFNSVGPEMRVAYVPRSKTDPRPWSNGVYRYTGREVHTVGRCGKSLNWVPGRRTHCPQLEGHDKACTS